MGCVFSSSWQWGRRFRHRAAGDDNKATGCRMCEIVAHPGSVDVAYEDEELLAFRDQFPSATQHYLIVPKRHVGSVYSLQKTKTDRELVQRMNAVALSLASASSVVGFHVPPFYSINHLHLHVVTPPWRRWYSRFKYLSGLCFFVTPQGVMKSLQ